jgi:hypothetical protein
MDLYNKIITIYPELIGYDFAFGKILLQKNVGDTESYIAKWEHPTLSKPTQEQLDALDTAE